ncbi:hypothetical protein ACNOYE_21105 [Nannocystaceae bacterium ST9]
MDGHFGAMSNALAEAFGLLDALGRMQVEMHALLSGDVVTRCDCSLSTSGIYGNTAVYFADVNGALFVVGSFDKEGKEPMLVISNEGGEIEFVSLAGALRMLELHGWPDWMRGIEIGERARIQAAVDKWCADCRARSLPTDQTESH